MRSQQNRVSDQIAKNQRATLLELLDRLLDKGVMVKGEILLSVADIDLVYLNLGLLLSSVKTVEHAAKRGSNGKADPMLRRTSSQGTFLDEPQQDSEREVLVSKSLPEEKDYQRRNSSEETTTRVLPSTTGHERHKPFGSATNIDQKNVEKGLVKLVLALVELIRKLMEKQAIRRIEDEQLDDREIEDLGNAFLVLDEKMEQLKKMFGLADEDLNLDLGPLGDLF